MPRTYQPVGSENEKLIARLVNVAQLDRNTKDVKNLEGEWVAIPEEDFLALREVVAEAEVVLQKNEAFLARLEARGDMS
jgi:hypothetical protein